MNDAGASSGRIWGVLMDAHGQRRGRQTGNALSIQTLVTTGPASNKYWQQSHWIITCAGIAAPKTMAEYTSGRKIGKITKNPAGEDSQTPS